MSKEYNKYMRARSVQLLSLLIWLLSLFVFAGLIIYINKVNSSGIYTDVQSQMLMTVMVIGVVSFFVMLVSTLFIRPEKKEITPNPVNKKSNKFSIFALAIVLIIIAGLIIPRLISNFHLSQAESFKNAGLYDDAIKSYIKAKSALFMTLNSNSEMFKIDQNISAVKTTKEQALNPPTPFITPTTIPIKTKTSIETDPIINCSIHTNCGGGSHQVRQSVCNNETCCGPIASECGGGYKLISKLECNSQICCQVGNGWSIYPSKDKCVQAQQSNQSSNQTIQNTQKSSGNNFYCYNNANKYSYYTSSGDQCNADNSRSDRYKSCMDTQTMKSNACASACDSEYGQNTAACSWAYKGINAAEEQNPDKYGECLNGAGGAVEIRGTCLNKCTEQHAQDIKQCIN